MLRMFDIRNYKTPLGRRIAASVFLLGLPLVVAIAVVFGTFMHTVSFVRDLYYDLKETFTVALPMEFSDLVRVIKTGSMVEPV